MSAFFEFVWHLSHEGRAILSSPPSPIDPEGRCLKLLEAVHAADGLDLAGPTPAFDPEVALQAAFLTWQACWYLLNRSEASQGMLKAMQPPPFRRNAGAQSSADLTFRYLPRVYDRAKSMATDDPLVGFLATLFRTWPLSGVLSKVEEGPFQTPDFDHHFGLELRYAERWSVRRSEGWKSNFEATVLVMERMHVG